MNINMEEKILTVSLDFVMTSPLLATQMLQVAEVTWRSLYAFQKLFVSLVF